MTLLSALFGVWLSGGGDNVFVQVGLVGLMGLACKNAILIVEFARELEKCRAAASSRRRWKTAACVCARS